MPLRAYVAWAHGFYARAYEPVGRSGDIEVLRSQASLLSAAEALECRAEAIQHWPTDDATVTRILAIAAGVATAVFALVILRQFGLSRRRPFTRGAAPSVRR